jgi:hypothetical protein
MLRFSFLASVALLCAGPLPVSAQENLTIAQAQKLVPERVWSKGSKALRLGAIQAGKRRFWTAHIWSPIPGEPANDPHGQCRLVFLERVSQKWSYLGHYLVDCAPVRRKGNRIWYEYYEKQLGFTLDENGPPAKLNADAFSFSSHYVLLK